MKINVLLASSLTLAACQFTPPLPLSITPKSQTVALQSAGQTVYRGLLSSDGQQEQFRLLRLSAPTEVNSPLAYLKFTLSGEGLSTPYPQDGSEFLPVDTPLATISNIPSSPGALRLIRVQGYDHAFQPLAAYEAWGYYDSQPGVQNIQVDLSRRQLLLGRILSAALTTQPLLFASLDPVALQSVLIEAMNYNADTGEFGLDPSFFDISKILALLPPAGSPLPTASDLRNNSMATRHDLLLTVVTPQGLPTDESVRLALNTPQTPIRLLPARSPSDSRLSLPAVPPGNWLLSAFGNDGRLLAQTAVVVDNNGAVITNNPLQLSNVSEYTPEFGVNSETVGTQSAPDLAISAEGEFIIVWESDDGSGTGIYARHYDSSGQPQAPEFKVNAQTSGNQSHPAVAVDSTGRFVISWESDDGSGTGIYAQRYDSSGNILTSEFLINTQTTGNQTHPDIALDSYGYLSVTWGSDDGSGTGIYARRYDCDGLPMGSEFQVNSQSTGPQQNPAIAIENYKDFVITWESDDGSGTGIYARRYDCEGLPQGTEFLVNTQTGDSQQSPTVGMDSTGNFVISWVSDDGSGTGIYAQRYDSTGQTQGAETLVNSWTTDAQNEPTVGMDSTGNFVIGWESDDGSGTGIYAQRYDSGGQARGTAFRVNSTTNTAQTQPAMGCDSSGNFMVGWQSEQDGAGPEIYAARYSSEGLAR